MFEEVNGMKDCLQRCVTGMAGAFKKSQISRQLKAMGLKRNRLTHSQVSSLPALSIICYTNMYCVHRLKLRHYCCCYCCYFYYC